MKSLSVTASFLIALFCVALPAAVDAATPAPIQIESIQASIDLSELVRDGAPVQPVQSGGCGICTAGELCTSEEPCYLPGGTPAHNLDCWDCTNVAPFCMNVPGGTCTSSDPCSC